jgi:hypothetical protein
MSQVPFKEVFVASTSTLLPQGKTVDNIAVGQLGLIDAKTHLAQVAPTYGKNKALNIVWGTLDLGASANNMGFGVPNENIYTKLIKGKNITGWKGVKAKRGQNEIATIGWSGDPADTDTLSANVGEKKYLYITLTGSAIDKEFSKQGITRQYVFESPVVDDCSEVCASVDPTIISKSLLRQITQDTIVSKYFKVKELVSCDPALDAPTTRTIFKFQLTIPDTKDSYSLAQVQQQAPTFNIKRVGTDGYNSVYETTNTANTAPSAFSNAGIISIPDCSTCPTGYTLQPTGFVYTVKKADAGDSTALTAVKTAYGISGSETGVRIAYQYGTSTYVLTSSTTLTAAGQDELIAYGQARSSCVLTSPTTTSWVSAGTGIQFAKVLSITLADDICGNNRLTELQTAYPNQTIAVVDSSTACTHSYSTSIFSDTVDNTCGVQDAVFINLAPYQGAEWIAATDAAIPDGTTCLTGLRFELAVVNRLTGDCTYDRFPATYDTVFITASTNNPDYHGSPLELFKEDWVFKKLQGFKAPVGIGSRVQKAEERALEMHNRNRSYDPVVRENEGYNLISKAGTYYDEYELDFSFSYYVGGWSQKYTDNWALHVFFPEGTGKNFEAAINGYLASASILIDPVVL